MVSKKYLIIDDSLVDASYLKMQLQHFSWLELVKICHTLEEAIEMLTLEKIDLVFLDVELSTQSGLDLFSYHLDLPPVIVVSSYPDFALDSYAIGRITDYLLKPAVPARLGIAINRAFQNQAQLVQDNKYIFLKTGRKIHRFDYEDIEYIEAYGIYSKVFSNKQMTIVNERMAALANLLPNNQFKRVHKSFIVNVSKIDNYDRNHFYIKSAEIPIGISFKANLESLLGLFE